MYGDSSINTDQSDPPNTWDSNFKGVWHMADNAANTTIRESTVTGANGTNNANTSTKTAAGQIGNALSYNGSTDGSFAAINLSATNIATLSFWMKWTTNANDDDLAFEYTPNYNTNAGGFIADWNASGLGGGKFETGMGKGDRTYWTDLFARPAAATWHLVHLVFNRSGPTDKVYVDGSLQTLTTGIHTASGMGNFSNSLLYFMSRAASSLNAAGTLDEVRLSTMERNPNWVATEYNNQSSPGTFIAMGSESCAMPTPTPTATPTPGLVAAYGFNEGSGTVVNDASGNGNNGTINGATWTTSGKYGNALNFNGSNALVTINNAASLQLTTGMTLEAWVYPTVTGPWWGDVIYKGNDNYYLEGTSYSSGFPAMGGTLPNAPPLYGTAVLALNTWAHLAATYDGATMRLYVNGVQVASRAQTGAIETSTNPLQIGGDSIYGQYFTGRIDEVRIYNRALSATQIQSDMNTPL
jgi:Concanavalin A-like lectin/glucanases superfamily